jgi:argininosuccinate lyase
LTEVNAGYATTTEIADALLRIADVPFRVGHHYASALTSYGRSKGLTLSEITYADAARIYREETKKDLPLTEAQFKQAISAEHMVYGSKGAGGPQLSEVERMLAGGGAQLTSDMSWLNSRKDHLATALSSLDKALAALVSP